MHMRCGDSEQTSCSKSLPESCPWARLSERTTSARWRRCARSSWSWSFLVMCTKFHTRILYKRRVPYVRNPLCLWRLSCFNRGSRFVVHKTSSKNPEVRRYFLNLWFSLSGLCATNYFIHITFKISGSTYGSVGLQGFSGPQDCRIVGGTQFKRTSWYSICHWDYCPKRLDKWIIQHGVF